MNKSLDEEFLEYIALTSQETEAAIMTGLIVIDTNVALNLYRWGATAANDLLSALEKAGDRLFVPHRVALEFWRRRRTVIREASSQSGYFGTELEKGAEALESTLQQWRKRTSAREADALPHIESVQATVSEAIKAIDLHAAGSNHSLNAEEDKILQRLRAALSGRVGGASPPKQHQADVALGLERFEERVPPGYGDTSKKGDERAGDYLVWVQALREAEGRKSEYLVFVTDDAKKGDWFEEDHGETVGPLPALSREALDVAGTRLLLIRPARYLALAERLLGAQVDEDSISSIEWFESEVDVWSMEEIGVFMEALEASDAKYSKIVLEACANGGRIARERVYALASFDDDRTLRGFTRPMATLVRRLTKLGLLTRDHLEDVLTAVYEDPVSYVLASHFEVPQQFVRWFELQDLS